jgi:hypothetical protein
MQGVHLDLLHPATVGNVDATGVAPPVVKWPRLPGAHGAVPTRNAAVTINLPI